MQKVPEKLKKLIVDAARRHAWNIGVSNFVINYMEKDEEGFSGGDRPNKMASMTTDRRYLTGMLRIFPCAVRQWKREGDAFMEQLVAHEVAHLATQHLYQMAYSVYKDEGETRDAWETLTETVGRMSCRIDKQLRKK